MGRTVPSFRMALEFEIDRWKSFRKALRSQDSLDAFDEMMDACRNHAMAGSAACNPLLFEPMVMSIILDQAVGMRNLQKRFSDLSWREVCATIQPEESKKTLTFQENKGDAYA